MDRGDAVKKMKRGHDGSLSQGVSSCSFERHPHPLLDPGSVEVYAVWKPVVCSCCCCRVRLILSSQIFPVENRVRIALHHLYLTDPVFRVRYSLTSCIQRIMSSFSVFIHPSFCWTLLHSFWIHLKARPFYEFLSFNSLLKPCWFEHEMTSSRLLSLISRPWLKPSIALVFILSSSRTVSPPEIYLQNSRVNHVSSYFSQVSTFTLGKDRSDRAWFFFLLVFHHPLFPFLLNPCLSVTHVPIRDGHCRNPSLLDLTLSCPRMIITCK